MNYILLSFQDLSPAELEAIGRTLASLSQKVRVETSLDVQTDNSGQEIIFTDNWPNGHLDEEDN